MVLYMYMYKLKFTCAQTGEQIMHMHKQTGTHTHARMHACAYARTRLYIHHNRHMLTALHMTQLSPSSSRVDSTDGSSARILQQISACRASSPEYETRSFTRPAGALNRDVFGLGFRVWGLGVFMFKPLMSRTSHNDKA